jgi:CubicO group peptidase (beta-lactamase class C family)
VDDRFADLSAEADGLMEQHSVPGLAIGMIIDGEEHTATFGVTSTENPQEVTDDTLFQIGSTTKTITATALMRLAEQGELGLDDAVRDHVPELELADPAVAESVTIRQLLNHTGGWAGDLFTDTGNGDDNTARYVEEMKELPQLTPVGTLSVYNNAGFSLAGRVIEKVTGETYEQAAGRLVVEPLGMDQSLFEPSAVMLRRFAVGHNVHPDGRVEIAKPWPIPRSSVAAGGLASSVRDQLRYASFHMGDGTTSDGSRLLSEQSMVEMQTPVVEFGNDAWVGLSWFISDLDGTKLVAHGGGTNGQLSAFWMNPERGVAFTSLTNGSTGALLNAALSELAQKLFLDYESPEIEPLSVDNPSELDEYTGRYLVEPNRVVYEIRREDDVLMISLIDRGQWGEVFDDVPDMVPGSIHLYDTDRVVMRGGDFDGEKGTFLRDDAGAVTYLRASRLWIKES